MMLARAAPVRRSPVSLGTRAWWVSSLHASTSTTSPAENWTTIRREAFQVIQSAANPIPTREVHAQLLAKSPNAEEKAKLTMTHLKTRILKSMKEAHHIRMKAVHVEGKKRTDYGWVVSKLPSFVPKKPRGTPDA